MARMQPTFRAVAWLYMLAMLAMLASAAPAAAELPQLERIRVLEAPKPIDDAELTDQHGQPFRLGMLGGRVAFVLFGFTHCPDVCPTAMLRMRELSAAGTLAADEVAYVLISVDGERDTPAVMREFLEKYSTDFVGLTAEPGRIKPIARAFSASFFHTGSTGQGEGYNVAHSPQIFVLDPAGRLRAEVYGASVEAMTALARALLTEAG